MLLTSVIRNVNPKIRSPKIAASDLDIFVAVSSLICGKCGIIKSSKTRRATEFIPLDSELQQFQLRDIN